MPHIFDTESIQEYISIYYPTQNYSEINSFEKIKEILPKKPRLTKIIYKKRRVLDNWRYLYSAIFKVNLSR